MSSPASLHKTNIVLKDTLAFHVPFMAPVLSVIVHVDVPLMAMYSIRVISHSGTECSILDLFNIINSY